MARIVETRPGDEGGGSRQFPWPVLEAGNESYPNGTYRVECEPMDPRGRSLRLRHEFDGAHILDCWRERGWLSFVCSVAAPRSMYRRVHHSSKVVQDVVWDPTEVGEFPVFTPMVVAGRAFEEQSLEAGRHAVHPLWSDRTIAVPKGARLVVGNSFKFRSGVSGLLDFYLKDGLDDGRFEVGANSDGGFKFTVGMASDLHAFLQRQPLDESGHNIVVHIVTAALSLLQRDWRDQAEWDALPNLEALADLLETNGLESWAEKGFCPEAAATRLYPLRVPIAGSSSTRTAS